MARRAATPRVSNHEATGTIAGSGRQSIVRDRSGRKGFHREGCELTLFSRQGFLAKRQPEALPDLQQRFGEPIDQSVVVIG
jgi:hypothetical protein